jgi:nitroreductase
LIFSRRERQSGRLHRGCECVASQPPFCRLPGFPTITTCLRNGYVGEWRGQATKSGGRTASDDEVPEYLETKHAAATLRGGPQSPDALLTTTRAVRKRLDLDRPVERAVIEECLRLAFQAPTGANSQGWGWVVVDDPETKLRMAEIYRSGIVDHQNRPQVPESPSHEADRRMSESVMYLADNLQRVPVLVVPTIDRRYGDTTTFQQASRWGSILPAVWSFMLALRSRGLGSAWTTIHLYREEEMAELLGIPYPEQTQAGLFPAAYTLGSQFSPADRSSSESRIFWNRWASS